MVNAWPQLDQRTILAALKRTYHPRTWQPATRWLAGIFLGFFVLQIIVIITLGAGWHQALFVRLADYPIILWAYVTSVLSHDPLDPLHLWGNILAFLILAVPLERWIGTRQLLWLFFAGGITAGLAEGHIVHSDALGASGAVMALFGAWIVLAPRHAPAAWRDWATIGVLVLGGTVAVLDLVGLRGQLAGEANIGHMAHLVGLLFGWVWAKAAFSAEGLDDSGTAAAQAGASAL